MKGDVIKSKLNNSNDVRVRTCTDTYVHSMLNGTRGPLLVPAPIPVVRSRSRLPMPSASASALPTVSTLPMVLGTSPLRIPVQEEELIEMIEPTESFTFSESQQGSIASLFAGVGSGALSSIACAPLDLVRTRMQVLGDLNSSKANVNVNHQRDLSIIKTLSDIVKKDGIVGCFRGLGPTLMTVPTFWGLYFPLYEITKRDLHAFQQSRKHQNSGDGDGDDDNGILVTASVSGPMVHMASAILSGAFADFFCNPMFVVRTRMQTEALHLAELPLSEQRLHGVVQTVKGLYAENGIKTFWKGFTASLMGLSHVGIQFPMYEYLKAEARRRSEDDEESAMDLLLASGISKMIATTLTYPHEVVRSRLMDYRGNDESRKGIMNTVRRIIRNEGIAALYTGIHVSLVRVVPNCCITFMTYEMILRWAKKEIKDEHEG